ncbi:hypothetical protein KC669_02395 [Candidatus Dojkabacteria bacterium]|uniref:Uncharacterized protein n=1 Tax=Candidatus Dojkabacteria bacterium TaxID=2099670 RepID=A0A955RM07_9BACT|nr:hypothetical protein [Candidatus Dojkabacteria bacterium]
MKEDNNSLPEFGHAHKIKENYQVLDKDKTNELLERLEKVNNAFKWENIILRGIVNGVFAAVGATLGIAILLLVLARVYSGLQDIPILEQFMNVTGLDQVVEYVIEQTSNESSVIDKDVSDTQEVTP